MPVRQKILRQGGEPFKGASQVLLGFAQYDFAAPAKNLQFLSVHAKFFGQPDDLTVTEFKKNGLLSYRPLFIKKGCKILKCGKLG
ncbi:hypothetical protein LJC47_02945, partial [Desulfosarcina sp. OttesenSCG-928-B08]|nr:hypothetical protein [Desulfosarcina sp. OttesenSCG-928-B08]